jgi:RNA polymerase sigma-70 factor (ECF subfamily)
MTSMESISTAPVARAIYPGTMTRVDEIVAAARAAWPSIELDPRVFAAYLAGREIGPCTSDLYLACACSLGNPQALAVFETEVLAAVDPALRKLGVSTDTIAEVKQRLRTRLIVGDGEGAPPRIVQFSGRGDLRGWVRVIAVRQSLALAEGERHCAPADDEALAMAMLPAASPEALHLKRLYRDEFRSCFAAAVASLPDRERLLLRQQFIDGLTIDDIGAFYRVHRATAARWLERARQHCLEGTLLRLRERLLVEPSELDSILRLIRSGLDLSLSPLRRPTTEE